MRESRDYFLRERYRGLDLVPRLSESVAAEISRLIEGFRTSGEHPESTPKDFSQELLFSTDKETCRRYLDGDVRFPFYSTVGDEKFWRSVRTEANYIERLVELYPRLDIDLVEQLWLERGRGMRGALPAPTDQKARWRAAGELTPNLATAAVAEGPYAAAIVTPRWGVGGSEKVMREMAASIERLTGQPTLIVVADTQVKAAELPPGAICLPNLRVRGEPFLRNPNLVRAMVLRDLLVELGAPRVISMNSFAANLLLREGALQRQGIKTAAAMFCLSVGPGGAIEGFAQIADWLIDAGVTLFTDNDHIAQMMAKENFYDETVVLAIPEPVTSGPAPDGTRVLWAGRIDSQKRPDLLVEIAIQSPHINYEVWGAPLLSGEAVMETITRQPNLFYRGAFDGFGAIDMTNIGCLLYTSGFDGTPNILLEAMARGLPCVCSGVGGIPDLMAEGRGVLVDADAPAQAYVSALDGLRGDPAAMASMANRCREYIRVNHNVEVFDRSVARLLQAL